MLPRSPRPASTRRARATRWPQHPVDRQLQRWLKSPGSLTARLRALGRVEVTVMSQGTRRLWPQEQHLLRQSAGHVREVVLSLDGCPVVWARSVTTPRALKGPWKALKGLGSRPLAELLFSHARVRRGPLAQHDWRPCGPQHGRARRDWRHLGRHQAMPPPPHWARQSVFWHHGLPLRVMESFSPSARRLLTP